MDTEPICKWITDREQLTNNRARKRAAQRVKKFSGAVRKLGLEFIEMSSEDAFEQWARVIQRVKDTTGVHLESRSEILLDDALRNFGDRQPAGLFLLPGRYGMLANRSCISGGTLIVEVSVTIENASYAEDWTIFPETRLDWLANLHHEPYISPFLVQLKPLRKPRNP